MKKARIFIFLLSIALLCVALSSCFLFGPAKPWEEGKLTNTFFAQDYLAEREVADFPEPKLEGSYLDPQKNILYLNLTREEFDAYVNDVVDYLRQKEAFKVTGFQCGSDLTGVFLLLSRYPLLATLDVEEIPYPSENERVFGFSTEELEEPCDGRAELKYPNFVSLMWKPDVEESGAIYTAVMEFPHFYRAELELCYHKHELESTTYPVPGSDQTTTISICKNCRETKREGYVGYYNDATKFSVSVAEGNKYIVAQLPQAEKNGELVEIVLYALENTEYRVTVNGTEIPKTKTVAYEHTYAFIMPHEDAVITVEAINTPEPHEHTGEWHAGEEAHWYEFTCGCESTDIAELHLDTDEDGICDICDYVMPEHKHTTKMTSDEFCHCTVYTCGCLTPPNAAPHHDDNDDGKCDICDYFMNPPKIETE